MSVKPVAITRQSLSKDVDLMRAMPQGKLSNVSHNKPSPPSTKGAVEALESVTINTSDPGETQTLTKAYIKAMRTEVLGLDGSANENLGDKLDGIRGKAEGISGALSEVKV